MEGAAITSEKQFLRLSPSLKNQQTQHVELLLIANIALEVEMLHECTDTEFVASKCSSTAGQCREHCNKPLEN